MEPYLEIALLFSLVALVQGLQPTAQPTTFEENTNIYAFDKSRSNGTIGICIAIIVLYFAVGAYYRFMKQAEQEEARQRIERESTRAISTASLRLSGKKAGDRNFSGSGTKNPMR